MLSQIDILRFFKSREIYEKYSSCIKEHNFLNQDDWNLFKEFGIYFEVFPHQREIDIDEFVSWYLHLRRPDLTNDQRESFRLVCESLKKDTTIEFSQEALKSFKDISCVLRIYELLEKGKYDLSLIKKELNTHENDEAVDLITETQVKGDLNHVLDKSLPKNGIKWPLSCLNSNLPALREGIYCIVGARPNAGKSSFMAHIVANALKQVERPIVWFNSEGLGENVCFLRVYQALYKKRIDEINANKDKIEDHLKKNNIYDKLYCHNMEGMTPTGVEILIKHYKPSLVVIDMIDDLVFPKITAKDSVIALRNTAAWGLAMAKKYCPIIATSQLSAEAEGKTREGYDSEVSMWPGMDLLEGSKTGKQAKANLIITLGKNREFPNMRYLEAPKNKFGVQGGLKHHVKLDYERSRFEENNE